MKTTDMKPAARHRLANPNRTSRHTLALVCVAVSSGLLLTAQQPQPVGSWMSVAQDVTESRVGAASAVLPDGRTLLAGGLVDGLPVASVVIYDPLTNAVIAAGEMTVARVRHTATLLSDGRVLFAGGRVADQVTPDLEVFSLPVDSEPGSAVIVGTMLAEREGHAAATLTDGRVLIAGGADAGGPLDTAEIFDPVTNTVQATWHPMNTARAGASATRLIDGRVLIAGGTTRDGEGTVRDLASAELYEPELQAFYAATTQMSVARSGHSALLLPHNNSVLIAGGSSNGALVESADLFLPAEFPDAISVGTGEFSPTGAMLAARHGAVAGPADDGAAFVTGGTSVDEHGDVVVSAHAETYRFATIKTDKGDYYPGETVFITGSGWVPGETVSLLLQEWENEHSDRVFEPIADMDGTIAASFLVEEHHLGVRFYLTARGTESKAQMTFTDGPRIGAVTVGAQNPAPLTAAAGNTATYGVSTARTQNGTVNGVMSIEWSTPAPAGIAHSFNPATWTANGGNAFPTVVLTLTTDGTTEAGTYPFTVKAAAGSDISTGGSGTLVVALPCSAPSITTQPSAVSITYGSNAVFTAAASGEPAPSVQWQVSTTAGATWADLDGQTATTLTLTAPPVALSGHQYRAVFTNNCKGAQIVPTDAATLTVGALAVTGSFTASSKVYDGDTTADVLTRSLSGVVGEDAVALIGGTAAFADANAGTSKVVSLSGASLSGADAGNYSLGSVDTTTADIFKADATISVEGYEGAYDGAAHGASGSATGVNDEALSGLDLGDRFTNVPGGTANWTFTDETGNYHDASGTAEIVIDKANATVNVTGYSGVYDGAAHGATGTATGVNGEALTGLNLGASFTNVPGGSANWTFTDQTGNYNDASGTGAIVIEKADATVIVTGYSGVYDGAAHGASGSATGVNGEALAGLTLGASFTNVPGGTANWAFSDATGNYHDESGSVAVVITTKPLTVTGITAISKPWDGNTVATLDLTGAALVGAVAGDAVTLNTGAATGTFASSSVGTWPVTIGGLSISGSSSGNYTLTQPTATATIGAWHMAGFHQPVGAINSIVLAPGAPLPAGNAGTMWHMIKGGNTVPLKFNVFTAEGGTELTTTSSAIASFQAWRLASCVGGTAEDALEAAELSTGGTLLRYDVTGGQFIQNWQTPKVGGSDSCYRATVTAKDGSTISAFFKVKK